MTRNIAPIELLVMILTFTPCLKNEEENDIRWSESFKSFIEYCLRKDPRETLTAANDESPLDTGPDEKEGEYGEIYKEVLGERSRLGS